MAWIYLIIAGVMEWGWPIGLKFASQPRHRPWSIPLAIVSIVLSGWLLLLAQRTIPIGTAYAVWTGIGAVGTFALGILLQAKAMGLAVPGRLAIVGLGDLGLLAGMTPALTTVRIEGARMGRIAATCIIDRAEGREVPERVIDIGFSLVERETT